MVQLSTTSSITDFLAKQGKPSDYNSRANLYKESGLEERLGKYVGSASQNTAFIKQLQTPASTGEVLKTYQRADINKAGTGLENPLNLGTAKIKPVAPTSTPIDKYGVIDVSGKPMDFGALNLKPPTNGVATDSKAPIDWSRLNLSAPAPASQALNTAQGKPTPISTPTSPTGGGTTPEITPTPTPPTYEAPAFSDTGTPTPADFGIGLPSEAELVQQYLDSSEYSALKGSQDIGDLGIALKAETAKENLQAKYEADRKQVEDVLGRNGLWFSGIRNTQVAALVQSLAMSLNQVDRTTAQALLESDATFKADILKGIDQLFTEAKNDNKDALKQLNEAGFVMIRNQIIPSLAAQRFNSDEENRKMTQEMLILSFRQKLNEFDALQKQREVINNQTKVRLGISMQNANTAQERNAILNQIREISLLQKTAVSPGQIISTSSGLPVKLTKEQTDLLAGFGSMLDTQIPSITGLLSKVTTGGISGRYMTGVLGVPVLQNTLSNDQQALLQEINQMNNSLIYLLSGKQINNQEFDRLKLQLPSLNYSNSQNAVQIESFSRTLKDIYSRNLSLNGWTMAGTDTGVSATNNLLSTALSTGDPLDDLAAEYGAE